ncbi:MAG TPA: TonB-dependent receptor [Vicinamibacterales bacterium]|nr:TonB-dependent receptor [Vicinamibacterales bacterium]
MLRCRRLVRLLVVASFLVLPAFAHAQIDTGVIVGRVIDDSGAVLPGVTVTATQQGTGVAATSVSNDRGEFIFPGLRVGSYDVAAELQGFKRAVRQDVRVNVQTRAQVDLQLSVGALNEQVTVTGRAELLQTQSADIGAVIEQRQVQDLPLLGRRYSELAYLTPGVVAAPAGITSRGEDTFFNANGNYATWNNYTLDGADNNSFSTNLQERSPQVVAPPVDALQEFKVQTRTYSAEFGKAAGAIINASVKQGTNRYSGSAFAFFRDEALNANTWDNNRAGRPKGPFNQLIAGFTFGGPIARGKTFFFGDYQSSRTERALTQTATVPTARMKAGDLSELAGTMTAANPFVRGGCVDAAAKAINRTCFDPVAARLLALFPSPNVPGTGFFNNNFVSNGILNNNVDQFDIRVDHQIGGGKDHVFARYSFQNTDRVEPPVLEDPVASGDFSSDILNRGQSAVAGWQRVFGGTLFNELRGSFNKVRSDVIHPAFGIDANAEYGIVGVPKDPRFFGGLPHIAIARVQRIGGPFFRPQFQNSKVLQIADNLTWQKGSHALKFGAEFRRDLLRYIDLRSLNGELSFSDGRYTGFGFGDFLLGLASAQRLTLFHEPDLYANGWQFYAQDSWRVRPDVTLSLGLRYEMFTPLIDKNNLLTNIDPATGRTFTAKNGSVFDRALIHPDRDDFAPRFGATWSATDRLVLRGGYGIFYQQFDRYGSESQLGLNLPQLVDASITANTANDAPAFTFAQGFTPLTPATVNPSLVQWRIQDPEQDTPIVHQFSFGPEFQFADSMVAAVEYVGNRTRNGRRLRNLNEGIISGTTVTFPYAQYGYGNAYLEQIVTNGRADYDALQARMQRRMSRGLAYTVAYTWSKAMGDFLDHLSAGGGAVGNNPGSAYAMEKDYGRLAFDIPHRLVTSFIYQLPFENAFARDWSVNGILTLSAGRPFTVTATDQAGTGPGRLSRANCVGDPVPDGWKQTLDAWMDPAAFAPTTPRTYGNCANNTVRGPGSKSMNLSVFRSIRFGSERRAEFRIETFNLFNWVNYGFPAANISNLGTFGRITSSIGDQREIQLAVKFYF